MGDDRIDGYRIECLCAMSTGFACGAQGTMFSYEKVDDAEMYRKVQEETLPNGDTDGAQVLKSLAISPAERKILVCTDSHQLYTKNLEKTDSEYEENENAQGLALLSQSFHHAAVTDLSVATRKSLVATCSDDGSLRIWNYIKNSLELVKYFIEKPLSIALHPSGLHVLVSFVDKLRLLNILVDDVCTFNDFPIKSCMECTFSHGGHQFAVANGNLIEIYSTYTCENIAQFKGHNNRIRSIVWALDDMSFTSCGIDGAIY